MFAFFCLLFVCLFSTVCPCRERTVLPVMWIMSGGKTDIIFVIHFRYLQDTLFPIIFYALFFIGVMIRWHFTMLCNFRNLWVSNVLWVGLFLLPQPCFTNILKSSYVEFPSDPCRIILILYLVLWKPLSLTDFWLAQQTSRSSSRIKFCWTPYLHLLPPLLCR